MKRIGLAVAMSCLFGTTLAQSNLNTKTTITMKLNAGIITPKLKETKTFYTQTLGFGVSFENDFYLLLHTPGHTSEISFLLPNHPSQQALFQKPFQNQGMYLTIEVNEVDSLYQRLKKQGVKIEIELRDEPWGDRHFAIQDPNGIGIDFVKYTAPAPAEVSPEQGNNKVTWFSLPADDVQRATRFYKEAFNWTIEPETKEKNDVYSFYVALNSKSDGNYISHERGTINGCIVKREIGLPSPAVLVEVDNLDLAIKKATKAGARLLTEKVVMDSLNGVFVLMKDTEGNCFELFQANP